MLSIAFNSVAASSELRRRALVLGVIDRVAVLIDVNVWLIVVAAVKALPGSLFGLPEASFVSELLP